MEIFLMDPIDKMFIVGFFCNFIFVPIYETISCI
jgi:hypothetical protein